MQRRDLFRLSTAAALTAALPHTVHARAPAAPAVALAPPATGTIPVAFLLGPGAVVIDFAGPWEVFDNVIVPGRAEERAFQLYTVAESTEPIVASGGMQVVPGYTFDTAPRPQVLVIPALAAPTEAMRAWIRDVARTADLTISVCTGAFVLASTGLLAGMAATTHHGSYNAFAMRFPDVTLRRGARYVESGKFASAGGLSSGIDLALRVVERYFGRAAALNTADAMEYQGQGWRDPGANRAYAKRAPGDGQPRCPICDMAVDKSKAPATRHVGKVFYFCMEAHKAAFLADPKAYAGA